jgi:hypothetical protein
MAFRSKTPETMLVVVLLTLLWLSALLLLLSVWLVILGLVFARERVFQIGHEAMEVAVSFVEDGHAALVGGAVLGGSVLEASV